LSSGDYKVNLPPGTYDVTLNAPSNGRVLTAQTVTVTIAARQAATATLPAGLFHIDSGTQERSLDYTGTTQVAAFIGAFPPNITATKKRSDSSANLSGAVFALYKQNAAGTDWELVMNGATRVTATSASNGTFSFASVQPGIYALVEVGEVSGLMRPEYADTFHNTAGNSTVADLKTTVPVSAATAFSTLPTVTVAYSNYHATTPQNLNVGNILNVPLVPVQIRKVDAAATTLTTLANIGGASYNIINTANSAVVATVTTVGGQPFTVAADKLGPGTYRIQETALSGDSAGYELSTDTVTFTILTDGTLDASTITWTDTRGATNSVGDDHVAVTYATASGVSVTFPNVKKPAVTVTKTGQTSEMTIDNGSLKRATEPLPGANFKLYRIDSFNVKHYFVIDSNGRITGETTNISNATTLTTDASGRFNLVDLDSSAEYWLTELDAPVVIGDETGERHYDPVDDFKISFTLSHKDSLHASDPGYRDRYMTNVSGGDAWSTLTGLTITNKLDPRYIHIKKWAVETTSTAADPSGYALTANRAESAGALFAVYQYDATAPNKRGQLVDTIYIGSGSLEYANHGNSSQLPEGKYVLVELNPPAGYSTQAAFLLNTGQPVREDGGTSSPYFELNGPGVAVPPGSNTHPGGGDSGWESGLDGLSYVVDLTGSNTDAYLDIGNLGQNDAGAGRQVRIHATKVGYSIDENMDLHYNGPIDDVWFDVYPAYIKNGVYLRIPGAASVAQVKTGTLWASDGMGGSDVVHGDFVTLPLSLDAIFSSPDVVSRIASMTASDQLLVTRNDLILIERGPLPPSYEPINAANPPGFGVSWESSAGALISPSLNEQWSAPATYNPDLAEHAGYTPMTNVRGHGWLQIEKRSYLSPNNLLSGGTFTLLKRAPGATDTTGATAMGTVTIGTDGLIPTNADSEIAHALQLSPGYYYLIETDAPAGYNTCGEYSVNNSARTSFASAAVIGAFAVRDMQITTVRVYDRPYTEAFFRNFWDYQTSDQTSMTGDWTITAHPSTYTGATVLTPTADNSLHLTGLADGSYTVRLTGISTAASAGYTANTVAGSLGFSFTVSAGAVVPGSTMTVGGIPMPVINTGIVDESNAPAGVWAYTDSSSIYTFCISNPAKGALVIRKGYVDSTGTAHDDTAADLTDATFMVEQYNSGSGTWSVASESPLTWHRASDETNGLRTLLPPGTYRLTETAANDATKYSVASTPVYVVISNTGVVYLRNASSSIGTTSTPLTAANTGSMNRFYNSSSYGQLIMKKLAQPTDVSSLPGATFKLFTSVAGTVGPEYTGASFAWIDSMTGYRITAPAGDYFAFEATSPAGYATRSDYLPVHITAAATPYYAGYNSPLNVNTAAFLNAPLLTLTVGKTTEYPHLVDENGIELRPARTEHVQGVEMQLYRRTDTTGIVAADWSLVATASTSGVVGPNFGTCNFSGLNVGEYRVVEVLPTDTFMATNADYATLAAADSFYIRYNAATNTLYTAGPMAELDTSTNTLTIDNDFTGFIIAAHLLDYDNHNIPIAGATFRVWENYDAPSDTFSGPMFGGQVFSTDSTGIAEFPALMIPPTGTGITYYIEQVSTIGDYVISDFYDPHIKAVTVAIPVNPNAKNTEVFYNKRFTEDLELKISKDLASGATTPVVPLADAAGAFDTTYEISVDSTALASAFPLNNVTIKDSGLRFLGQDPTNSLATTAVPAPTPSYSFEEVRIFPTTAYATATSTSGTPIYANVNGLGWKLLDDPAGVTWSLPAGNDTTLEIVYSQTLPSSVAALYTVGPQLQVGKIEVSTHIDRFMPNSSQPEVLQADNKVTLSAIAPETLADASDDYILYWPIETERPQMQVTKTRVDSGAKKPGDEATFHLTLKNVSTNPAMIIEQPILIDYMPREWMSLARDEVTGDPKQSVVATATAPGVAADVNFQIVDTLSESVMMWTFPNSQLAPGESVTVEVTGKLAAIVGAAMVDNEAYGTSGEALRATAQFPTGAQFTWTTALSPSNRIYDDGGANAERAARWDKLNAFPELQGKGLFIRADTNVNIARSGSVNILRSIMTNRENFWYSGANPVTVYPGDTISYRLQLNNDFASTTNATLRNISITDVLPYSGDWRSTGWTAALRSLLQVDPASITVESAQLGPLTGVDVEIHSSNTRDLFTDWDGTPAVANAGQTVGLTTDTTSFRVDFPGLVINAEDTITIIFEWNIPQTIAGSVIAANVYQLGNVNFQATYDLYRNATPLGTDIKAPSNIVRARFDVETIDIAGNVWEDAAVAYDGVHDIGEAAIPGATVQLWQRRGSTATLLDTTVTDANGDYLFAGVRSCYGESDLSYQVVFVNPDTDLYRYSPAHASATTTSTDSDAETVSAGSVDGRTAWLVLYDSIDNLDCGLWKGSYVAGRAWFDENANGAYEVGETLLANVGARLVDNLTGATVATTMTAADGSYRFNALRAGDYSVVLDKSALFAPNWTYRWTTPNVAAAGEQYDSDAVPIDAAGTSATATATVGAVAYNQTVDTLSDGGVIAYANSLGGRVWHDTDRDGVRQSTEAAFPNVQVKLFKRVDGVETLVETTLTAADGTYRFEWVDYSPGIAYQILFVNPQNDHWWFTTPFAGTDRTVDSDAVRISDLHYLATTTWFAPDGNQDAIDAGLFSRDTVAGWVFLDANHNGLFDDGEYGVGNVTVQLSDAQGSQTTTSIAAPGPEGHFLFTDLNEESTPTITVLNPDTSRYRFTTPTTGGSIVVADAGHTLATYDIGPVDYFYGPVRVGLIERVTLTFDAQDGTITGTTLDETATAAWPGDTFGAFPSAEKPNHSFLGWFTKPIGGTQVMGPLVADTDMTLYAHYVENVPPVVFIQPASGNYSTDPLPVTLTATDVYTGVSAIYYLLDSDPTTYTYTGGFNVGEGTHTVTAWAVDGVGNVGPVATTTWVVDATAPLTTLTTPTHSPLNAADVAGGDSFVTLTATDFAGLGVYATYYRVDGSADVTYTAPFDLAAYGQGTHVVTYWSVDVLGNIETPATTRVFVIDTVAPVTTPNPLPATAGADLSSIVLWPVDPNPGTGVAVTYYRLNDSTPETYTGRIDFTTQGTQKVEFWSVDVAGNVEVHQIVYYNVDTASAHTVISPFGGISAETTFTLTCDETSATVYYQINGDAETVYTGPVGLSVSGVYTVAYWSVDALGNREPVQVATFLVDTDAPQAFIAPNPATYLGESITLSAVDVGVGVAEIHYSVTGDTVVADTVYTGAIVLNPGTSTVTYWAVDGVGNVSDVQFATYTLDGDAPVSWLNTPTHSPLNAVDVVAGDSMVTLDATDTAGTGVAHLWYRVDGAARLDYLVTGPFDLAAYGEGQHTITYWAVDASGNIETPANQNVFVIDTVAPVTVPNPLPSLVPTTVTQVVLYATDPNPGTGVAATYYKLNSDPTTYTYTGRITLPGQGTQTVEFWSVDVAGNVEVHQVVTYNVDTTGAHTVISPFGGTSAETTFTLTCSDASADVYYQINGGPQTLYTGPVALNSTGTYTVTYWSVDDLGNTEQVQVSTFVVDTDLPVAHLTPAAGLYGADGCTFGVSGTDVGVGVAALYYTLDGGADTLYTDPVVLTAGTHTVTAWAVDGVGNVSAVVTYTYTVDDNAPVTTITPASSTVWRNDINAFSLTATDNLNLPVVTYYSLDGAPYATYTTGATVALADGAHFVNYYSVDAAGNIEVVRTAVYLVDHVAPVSTITPDGGVNPGAISITATDTLSGVDHIDYRVLDDTGGVVVGWTVYTGPITLPGDGTYQIEYRATDRAGNVEATRTSRYYTVDGSAPETVLTTPTHSPLNLADYLAGDCVVTLVATDYAGVGIDATYYVIDGGVRQTYTGPFDLKDAAGDGTHSVLYWSVDAAGNVETPAKTSVFVIDTVAPVTTVYPTPSLTATTVTQIVLQATDPNPGTGVAATYYRLNDSSVATYTGRIDFTTQGTQKVEFWSVDVAGNTEVPQVVYYNVDTVAAHTVISPFGGISNGVTVSFSNNDPDATVYYQINGDAADTYSTPFDLDASGVYTITYWSVDAVGNVEQVQVATFLVDADAPVALIAPDGGLYAGNSLDIHLSATDVGVGVTDIVYSIDGGADTTYTAAITLPAGTHTVTAWAVDGVGNVSTRVSETYTIDGSAPVTVITPASDTTWRRDITGFSLTATDNVNLPVVTYYSLDGAAYVVYTPGSTVPLAQGAHFVNYYSVDAAGNIEVVHTATYLIDRTAPTSTITPDGGINTGLISITATDNLSGVDFVRYRILRDGVTDITGWTVYTGPISITQEGNYVIEYYSTDRAGNVEPVRSSDVFYYDHTPPQSFIVPVTSPTRSNVATVTAYDMGSGVAYTLYYLDQSAPTTLAANGEIPLGADGTHIVTYWSVDRAGNVEVPKTQVLVVDTTAPELRYSPTQTRRKTADVTLAAKDNLTGVDEIYYWTEGVTAIGSAAAPEIYVGPIELSVAGTTTVHFWATDRVGNTSGVQDITYNCDPDVPLTRPTLLPGQYAATEFSFVVEDASPTTTWYLINDLPQNPQTPTVWDGNPIQLPTGADGIYDITYWSADDRVNTEPRNKVTYLIDTTAPVSEATPASAVPVQSQDVHLWATDELVGVKTIWYQWDAVTPGTPQILAMPAPAAYGDMFHLTESGTYELHWWAEDKVGNIEDEHVRTYVVDADAPVTTADLFQPTTTKLARITLTADDPTVNGVASGVDQIYYSLNQGAYQPYTGPLTFTDDGVYAVDFYAVDAAGNVEIERTIVVHLATPTIITQSLPATTTGPSSYSLPPTGETERVLAWIALAVLVTGGVVAVETQRRRRRATVK
jgi:hypothetical protein